MLPSLFLETNSYARLSRYACIGGLNRCKRVTALPFSLRVGTSADPIDPGARPAPVPGKTKNRR